MNSQIDIARDSLLDEILEGLSQPQKTLPCKFFYDERGSKMFEEICRLEEYYPTRTEIEIMNKSVGEMAALIGDRSLLIEYGSGASVKIRLLLNQLDNLAAYVPIDIAEEHLIAASEVLSLDYPRLRIIPVSADYTKPFPLPDFDFPYTNRIVYFPGSTIGNFTPDEARAFLHGISRIVGTNGGLLIGVDLKKDRIRVEAAYNDAEGVTAAFNMNMLVRLQNEFGADVNLNLFEHRAVYDEIHGRIEMHLVSLVDQQFTIVDRGVHLSEGESILTEYSYKYTVEEFAALVSDVFHVRHVWIDDEQLFSVQYLTAKPMKP